MMDKQKEIQIAALMRQLNAEVRRLRSENGTLRDEAANGAEGPFEAAVRIILSDQMNDKTRIEAAGLVLERSAPEAVTEVAERYLNAVTKRTDLHPDLVLDACKHLAKRHVPRAATPGTAAAGPSKAEQARRGRGLLKGRARLTNLDAFTEYKEKVASGEFPEKKDVDGNVIDLSKCHYAETASLKEYYDRVDAAPDEDVLAVFERNDTTPEAELQKFLDETRNDPLRFVHGAFDWQVLDKEDRETNESYTERLHRRLKEKRQANGAKPEDDTSPTAQ